MHAWYVVRNFVYIGARPTRRSDIKKNKKSYPTVIVSYGSEELPNNVKKKLPDHPTVRKASVK